MKNLLTMALMATALCFATIACTKEEQKPENNNTIINDDPGDVTTNPFAGNTYKAIGEGRDENDYFAFEETRVSWGPDNYFNYTYDETTFTLARGTVDVATVNYTFSADKDTLSLSSSAGISGTYVKEN